MKTKIFLKIMGVAIILMMGYSCNTDKLMDLDNPKYMLTPANSDMSMMFTNVLRDYGRRAAGGNTVRVHGAYVKYYASYSNLYIMGGLTQFDQGVNDDPWGAYQNCMRWAVTLEDYLVNLNDPNQVNNLAFTRIMKVAIIQRLSDFYGDVPVSEAGLGYISSVYKPKYDKQQDIYTYMLETLDAEASALTDNSTIMQYTWKGDSDSKKTRDIVYSGDTKKWKKYAYSLMLRIAMRMSAVDAATAKTYAEKAIAGGVILTDADNWTLKTKDNLNDEKNPYSSWFEGSPSGDPERYTKLGEYFVDFLKNNNDPRQKVYFGGRLNAGITDIIASDMQKYWRDASKWNWDLTQAKGMAHGTNANPCASVAEYHQTYTSPNPFLYTIDQPLVVLTASEMLYLIAEASLNGWITGTTADAAYASAITTNMEQLSSYSGLLTPSASNPTYPDQKITAAEISAYIAAKPLGTGDAARLRLAEEMWVSLYMNPSEAWFNVRRMDLNLPANSATAPMPVRNAYSENDRSNNIDNLNIGLQQMGLSVNATREEEIATRVWWDTKDNF